MDLILCTSYFILAWLGMGLVATLILFVYLKIESRKNEAIESIFFTKGETKDAVLFVLLGGISLFAMLDIITEETKIK